MESRDGNKFDGYQKTDLAYSTISDHKLWASFLTPEKKAEQTGTHLPVLVFWHGGGFVTGHRMYEPWWPQWLLELGLSRNAMLVSPDYRLLPEATGSDILEDMDAFWTWFLTILPTIAESDQWNVRPDLNRIVCVGQSAGGSIAVHSALERPDAQIKAVITLYAPLSMVPQLKMARPRKIMGSWPPPSRQAEVKIRAYIQSTKGTIRTSSNPADMWELMMCILQQGWMPRLVQRKPDQRLDTIAVMEEKKALPPMWLVHGQDDSVVSLPAWFYRDMCCRRIILI